MALAELKRRVDRLERVRKRIDLRADPIWSARLRRQADLAGVSISDYIRRAVEDQLARDEMYQSSKR